MIEVITVLVLGAACLIAFHNWRNGLVASSFMALLQDPLRKLTDGQPVYFVVLTGAVFAFACAGAVRSGLSLRPRTVYGWRQGLGVPFVAFVVIVVAQAAHSFARYDNPMIPAIGLLSYLAGVPALVLAHHFAISRGLNGIRNWMWVYCAAAMLFLTSVYLEFSGLDWPVLDEVGVGLMIYDVGTILKAYSGFYRASEIAAWHVATVSCFLFLLFAGRKLTTARFAVVLGLVAFLLSVGVLTGRRKMFVEVAVFLSAYFFLLAWFQRGANRLATASALAGLAAYVLIVGLMAPDKPEESSTKYATLETQNRYDYYAARGQTVFEAIPQRFSQLGIEPIAWAIEGSGWLGAGLGAGSQGVQHFVAQGDLNTGAAEGGLGKITLELGFPGLIVALWLAIAFLRHIARILPQVARRSRRHALAAYALLAFLIANAATFSVATQAYGDVYILMSIGWAVGFLLAMPQLAVRDADERAAPRPRGGPAPRTAARP